MMACLTAGRLGLGSGPATLFFPPGLGQATCLQERICDHDYERVSVQARPGSPLEVAQAELLLQLLMRLLAYPARLHGGGELLGDVSAGRLAR